ncbi:MAG: RidA family protein [Alphaproteobacteria bacterium]
MNDIRRHDIPESKAAKVYRHVVFDGDYVFIAGQLASDRTSPPPALGDIETETRTAMELLGAALRSVGLDYEDVMQARVFMTDLSEFQRMNAVYGSFFPAGETPARTCVGVASLLNGCRIEIDFVARMRKFDSAKHLGAPRVEHAR